MASGTTTFQEKDKEWKLKKIRNFWFLDVGGKLKRLNILDNAEDVQIEDNVIFADEILYQLIVKSDGETVLHEIEDVHKRPKSVAHEVKQNSTIIDVSNNSVRSDSVISFDLKEVAVDKADDNSSRAKENLEETQITESEHASESDEDSIPDYESDYSLEKGHEEYDDEPRNERDDVSLTDSDSDYTLEKGHEEYFDLPEKDVLTVRAKFDFDAVNGGDLSFKKGDTLEVNKDAFQNSLWLVAKHFVTGSKGNIPVNYVTKNDSSPQSQDYWYNVDRETAEKLLLRPGNPTGTFLVRKSADKVTLVLSVRKLDPKIYAACVRHYKIMPTDAGGVYITPKRIFKNITDLIFHHIRQGDGLCCKLEIPCPQVRPLEQFKELEISRESVKLLKKLGGGSFGEVYVGKWCNTIDVAVKTLKLGQKTTDEFLAEAKLMHHLRHNKLVQLMAVCTKSEPVWIITELMTNGALLDYLQIDEGKTLKLNDLADIACQIADGMAYLEMENFVHRDLRAANIFLGDRKEVKVADFGLARLIQDETHENKNFPTKWTAPEAAFERKFSIKSDVWSYGVLLFELITFGKVPYLGMNVHKVLNLIMEGFRMQKPTGGSVPCPDPYYEIMLKCWNKLADSRPTFAYLQDFFNNYLVSVEGEYRAIDD